jgi:hypothetical protein
MITKFINYFVSTVSLLYDAICCLKRQTSKYNINLIENLQYINVNVNTNTNLTSETEPILFEKYCDNKICKKKLEIYGTWFCYDGHAYCCSDCRLKFIKNKYCSEPSISTPSTSEETLSDLDEENYFDN